MSKFESVFNSNVELPPHKSRESIYIHKKLEEESIPEKPGRLELEIKKREQRDVEQAEILRKELKEMQTTEADAKSEKSKEPLIDIDNGKKILAGSEMVPFSLISSGALREMSGAPWFEGDAQAAISGELEKRENRNQVAETFLSVIRFAGRNSVRAVQYLLDAIYFVRTLHWEERPLKDALERARMLKKQPLFRAIGEAEEKKIKDKIEAMEKTERRIKRD